MDQAFLVKVGHLLMDRLNELEAPPRAAVWVHSSDSDIWKLWVVPHSSMRDKREFYRKVVEIISASKDELAELDVSDVEFVTEDNKALKALGRLFHVKGNSSLHVSDNNLNGFYLPDGIILRLT